MNPSRIAYLGITSPKIIINSAGEGKNYIKALECYPPKVGGGGRNQGIQSSTTKVNWMRSKYSCFSFDDITLSA